VYTDDKSDSDLILEKDVVVEFPHVARKGVIFKDIKELRSMILKEAIERDLI
jgi:hypothetical protein